MSVVSCQVPQTNVTMLYDDPPRAMLTLKTPTDLYPEFTANQQRDPAEGTIVESLSFFQAEFSEPVEPLPLFPFAKPGAQRKAEEQYGFHKAVVHLDASVVSRINKVCQTCRVTPFHFYLSAFQVMLHRLLDTDRMCIGVVEGSRSDQKLIKTTGLFPDIVPLLFKLNRGEQFVDVLKTTRTKTYTAFADTGVPIEDILRACGIPSWTTETPLFQVGFSYQTGTIRTSQIHGIGTKVLNYADLEKPFDLVTSVDETGDGTAVLTLSLQDSLYDADGAQLLADTYAHLLGVFAEDTDSIIGRIAVFDESRVLQAVKLGTGPSLDLASPSIDTLSKIVNTWAVRDPHSLAVKDSTGEAKTYSQLSERANVIACMLLNAGVGPSSLVGVLLNPGVDTIATILAILRLGAVYIPLDTRRSDAQLSQVLHESTLAVLIYDRTTAFRAELAARECPKVKLITLDGVPQEIAQKIADVSTPDDLAMVLYTSGSTGRPKGIPLTNANLRTPILSVSERVPLGREVVLQQSGQGFDAAIYQIFIALTNGGTLVMADNREDPAKLAATMCWEGVTCTTLIVSEMQALLKHGYTELRGCASWRIAMVAGEAFTVSLLDQFRSLQRPDLNIINAYGPTEASICSSMAEVSQDLENTSIPIGKALANYGTYIVDEAGSPVPLGWPGEIAITGPGVASGYLDLPELTRQKFKTPRAATGLSGKGLVYLTGDKGRMLQDGSIVISGRVDGDDQVKIRGHRVHLMHVAKVIVKSSRGILADAAVVLKGGDDTTQQQLVAYIVLSRTSNIQDMDTYLRQLSQELPVPSYMRPALILPLDTLPVTERGKLDTKTLRSLPLPKAAADGGADDDLTGIELQVREIWRRILGEVSLSVQIRRHSDFFSVGGNSLLLLSLRAEIRREFGVELSLPELFQASTLGLIAGRLAGTLLLTRINWNEETRLDEKMFAPRRGITRVNGANGNHSSNGQDGISVLLTGATGFLGTGLLRQLVEMPQVSKIHCAALRSKKGGKTSSLGVGSPKIVRHQGDLTLPLLGMSEAESSDLFKGIHVIIHNGADVSHMKNYRSLKATNVSSTVELARLALAYDIPLHFVSSGSVAHLSGAKEQDETSLAAFHPPTDGSDGYVASKWASEVLLEKVYRRFGGQIWIHRPSSITGDGVPASDVVHSLISWSRQMKAVPEMKGSTGFLDLIHVAAVSKSIAECAVIGRRTAGQDLIYIHQSGEQVVPVGELREYVEKLEGQPVQVLPMDKWVSMAIRNGLDEVLGSYMLSSKGVIRAPLLKRYLGKGYKGEPQTERYRALF